ncbi:DUF2590 family protein [uncultured Amphritea sp.]|uniref:DUF2590 family protein n=1 Tax=uncultured Amphritea sp. TaxID=981605 RepID=UPI0025DFF4F0|nr:DUF2590 family protein [uncultured Amphritea sp.]
MAEIHHVDILITDDDITLDAAGIPVFTEREQSIAQDIKHMIRESGLLTQMIAERDPEKREMLETQIILLVEDDRRLIPGTINFELETTDYQNGEGRWFLTADTYQYGTLQVTP